MTHPTQGQTAEAFGYGVFDKSGKLRFVAPNEHDAHMSLILSSADPDEFDIDSSVKPLYTRPDQSLIARLTEALQNLKGCLDTPLARRHLQKLPIYQEAIATARAALASAKGAK
jgi:hypothetical protein